jgi:molybdenum cofactor cytidylyltransferase
LQFAVIILGAGRSSRMGQPNLLLPLAKETIVGHSVRQWATTGSASICVVVAADHTDLTNEVRKSGAFCITNPDPDRGMFSSVRCAAEWPHWDVTLTHWIISLGDQPHLRDTTLRQLIGAVQTDPESVWQPACGGRRRHPVVLPKSSFAALRETTAADLKTFLALSPIERKSVEIDDPGLDIDIDTPGDYARAKKFAGLE